MLHRIILCLALAAGGCAALLLGAVAALESEWAERRIADWAGRRLGRTVSVDGIDVQAAWPPRVALRKLRVANPQWARSPALIDAEGLDATFLVSALFVEGPVVDRLTIERGSASLERDGDRTTWQLGNGRAGVAIREVRVGDALIHYRDEADETVLLIDATGTAGAADGRISAQVTGSFRGDPVRARVTAASVPVAADQVVPVSFEATLNETRASGSGKLRADGDGLRGMDLQLKLAGASLGQLSGLVRVDLPDTPPYQLNGRVHYSGERWTFDPFRATLGGSDVSGRWSFEQRDGRRYLRGQLRSDVIDLDDLGAADAVAPADDGAGGAAQAPIPVDGWDTLNADMRLEVRQLRHARALPIDSLALHAKLSGSRLHLDPLTLGMAGSRLEGRAELNAAHVPARGAVAPHMRISSSLAPYRDVVTRISSLLLQALRHTVASHGCCARGSPAGRK